MKNNRDELLIKLATPVVGLVCYIIKDCYDNWREQEREKRQKMSTGQVKVKIKVKD